MYSSELWKRLENIFLWFLQLLITAGYKTIKSQNTVFVRGGGEGGSGNGGGWVFRLSLQCSKEGREPPKLNKCKQEGRHVQILGILWWHNWLSPTQKSIVKATIYVNKNSGYELHLVHIKSQKLSLMQKTKIALDQGERGVPPIPFRIFVDVTIFDSGSMQHLRWSSL